MSWTSPTGSGPSPAVPPGTTPIPSANPPATTFEQLYRAQHPSMVRLAALIVGSPAEAEELVHDAFLGLHRRFSSLDEPAAYLRTAVVNACRSVLRRRVTAARTPVPPDNPYAVMPGEPSLVAEALAQLPERQRIALVLRYYHDLTVDEVAKAIGCRRGAAASLIHRGLDSMREVL